MSILDMITNAVYSRSEFYSRFFRDNKKDVYKECGYPTVIMPEEYQLTYDRCSIAKRVVEVLPLNSWKVAPTIYEDEAGAISTQFEKDWDELGSNLGSDKSYHKEEEGSKIWEYLKRADILAGIGQYSVILLGIADGKELTEPVTRKKGMKLTYIRVFSQAFAKITALESDIKNPRYGQPTKYQISLNDPGTLDGIAASGPLNTLADVHWTRVVHISKNNQSNEWFGHSEMKPVYNELKDIVKVSGAGSEGYWRSCFTALSFETNPQLGGDVDVDTTAVKKMAENYTQGLDRNLFLKGMTAKTLAPQIIDPTPFERACITRICIALNIPESIFLGTQTGTKAGDKDESGWDDIMEHRFNFVVKPRIIVPFVDRLINIGILSEPAPENGYKIKVNGLHTQSESDKADVVQKTIAAIAQYEMSGASSFIAPLDLLTRIMDYSEEEALQIIENAKAYHAEKQQRDIDDQKLQIEQGIQADPNAQYQQ